MALLTEEEAGGRICPIMSGRNGHQMHCQAGLCALWLWVNVLGSVTRLDVSKRRNTFGFCSLSGLHNSNFKVVTKDEPES